MRYTVVCDNARSGDAIERPVVKVEVRCSSLPDAVRELHKWYRGGPNGPARSAYLLRDGEEVDGRSEIERTGHVPLFNARGQLVDCSSAADQTAHAAE